MDLDQIVAGIVRLVMKTRMSFARYRSSIYGAIRQMNELDRLGIEYEVVPA
jgi:precorrin-4 methylase